MTSKKRMEKKTSIKVQPRKMSIAISQKERLVLSYSEEDKTLLKVAAALKNKTVSEYLLDLVKRDISDKGCDFPGCDGTHIPNEETARVLRDTEAGRNLESHKSLNDFWKAMGMKPNVRK